MAFILPGPGQLAARLPLDTSDFRLFWHGTASLSGNFFNRSTFRILAFTSYSLSACVHGCTPTSTSIVTHLVTRSVGRTTKMPRMDHLIDVATWVSLIAALLGISLAIVAIWFTFSTDARSRRVSEQMIKSLQKIEGFVERSSSDTQGLIKVGWDRMLGNMATPTPDMSESTDDSTIKQIAEGLAEEVRTHLIRPRVQPLAL